MMMVASMTMTSGCETNMDKGGEGLRHDRLVGDELPHGSFHQKNQVVTGIKIYVLYFQTNYLTCQTGRLPKLTSSENVTPHEMCTCGAAPSRLKTVGIFMMIWMPSMVDLMSR